MLCASTTNSAAIRIGSLLFCGCEPCAPTPRITTSMLVELASSGPPFIAIEPAGVTESSCSETTKSGWPKRSYNLSESIARAPSIVSSEGCPIRISVPCHPSLREAISRAVPNKTVMWISCPQACMTPTSCPCALVERTVDA